MNVDEIVVLIASPLEPTHVERMRAVDSRITVVHRPDLVGAPRYLADHDIVIRRTPQQQAEWDSLLREAEILFDFDKATPVSLERRAPRLRWIQATSSGVGAYIEKAGLVDSKIIVTNAAGIHAVPLAEFVLMTTLMLTRGMLHAQENQRLHRWERFTTPELTGRVMLIVGVGRVGTEVARRARSFGMRVIGVKRDTQTANASEHEVDELIGTESLAEALPRADIVVLALPLTVHTRHLIGERELRLMKPSACLINIGRGAVVDEPALVRALQDRTITSAALDVFETEPLPTDNPLWDMPNVIVTSHCMSQSELENDRLTDLFCRNLSQYLRGDPLRNVVDKARGY